VSGFRFFFYSEEGNEPVHIHVSHGGGRAKFWLQPDVVLASSIGFSAPNIKKAKKIIEENKTLIEESWHEYNQRRTP
jgi:hypothetical protein